MVNNNFSLKFFDQIILKNGIGIGIQKNLFSTSVLDKFLEQQISILERFLKDYVTLETAENSASNYLQRNSLRTFYYL